MTTLTAPASAPTPGGVARLRRNRLLSGLTFPHGVDGYRDAFRPGVGAGTNAATVVALTTRTSRATSILLRPEVPMTFAAGQHVLVTSDIDGVRHTRCYSLSDTPHRADGLLEITVAYLPDGKVSSHLTQSAQVGQVLGLSAPRGRDFILPARRPERLVLIGGGSGITPLRSMWRTMAAEGLADRVQVLYYARTRADALFAQELGDLADATIVLTRQDDSGTVAGRFDSQHLSVLGIDPAQGMVYVCGPSGLTAVVAEHVATRHPLADCRVESFAPAVAPSDPAAAQGVLTFARSGRSAHNDGATLLDQAETAGLTPAAGCRMGICHTCITTKHAGVVRDIRTGQTDDGGDGEIQLCISQAVGDVQLDL
ncbi:MAG: flavin reductase family protein [Euzebya sp.]